MQNSIDKSFLMCDFLPVALFVNVKLSEWVLSKGRLENDAKMHLFLFFETMFGESY